MLNFSIATQVRNELKEFYNAKIELATIDTTASARILKKAPAGDYYNQAEKIALIDLYYNSKFEKGPKDSQGQTMLFLNVGKFRTDVASKQIRMATKDFKFLPDDYSDPWVAFFLQKEFKEYSKETNFGELINECEDAFPKYGTIVLKRVGKELKFMPLQLLRNEQTAKDLMTSKYVIEEHPDMSIWEIKDMPNWNTEGLQMSMADTLNVYERYGRVTLKWLKENDGKQREVLKGDENKYVDAMVICATEAQGLGVKDGAYIFYAGEVKAGKRPYMEAHWSKKHGRWLGCGVMEDLLENQQAKNIIINLIRRSLHWSSKRVFQTAKADVAAKNLVKQVPDGTILDVGANGSITEVNLSAKTNADFSEFLGEFEKNADQKAFTYEVATGEALPSGTPFRLGVVLSNAVNTFFQGKREKLGLFLNKAINEYLVPQFMQDMQNEDKIVSFFSDEPGFEVLKEAAMNLVKSETTRMALLTGKPIDAQALQDAVNPFQLIDTLFFKRPKDFYKDVHMKYDLTSTGEEVDVVDKIETLKTIYQLLSSTGQQDRANKVLDKIASLKGISMAQFGSAMPTPPPQPAPAPTTPQPSPAMQPAGNPNAAQLATA